MAVHGCISQKLLDPDDSEPITFKRTNTSSQGSDLKSPESRNSCQSSEKSFFQQASPKGENTYSRRSKVCPAAKVLTEASDKHQDVLNNSQYGTAFSDDSDDDKPLSFRRTSVSAATKQIISAPPKEPTEEKHSDDDSDDDKPLSSRLVASTGKEQKSNFPQMVHSSRTLNSTPQLSLKSNAQKNSRVKHEEESSSKFSTKSSPGTSMKSHDSLGKKPLAYNIQLNGSSKRESNNVGTTNNASSKRPLGSTHGSVQSANKKAKLLYSPASEKVIKKESFVVKDEPETTSDDDYDDSDDDDDRIPLSKRIKKSDTPNSQRSSQKIVKKVTSTPFKKVNRPTKKPEKNLKYSKSLKVPPGSGEGQKWTTLEHNGVIFPPPYKFHGIKMLYNGKEVDLTPEQEEVATMFAVMKDTEYASKKTFIENFMNDWRVILGKNHVIKKFELCDFTPIYEWHLREKEKKKQLSTEEKKALKEEKLQQEEKFMWAIVDGVKEKVGNFRVEPPGLFRGRGEHPKMGKLKKRIYPHDITINIGKKAKIPECPIPGERWKEIKHDNTVTWLAFWNDPINGKEFKYVFLAASSSLKGQSDKEKYEKARKLNDYICNIRANYTRDFMSKDEMKRQIAVATYLIDKLALRAGNEKDDDEADTVGCCTLKVENVTLVPPNKLQFDFLGKDSIRYFNTVEVELPVYKAIGEFRKGGKKGGDDLFDKLDTSKLNAHLKELMPGLTAKVFRTYNASITLDQMLNNETEGDTVPEKIAVYQSANKEVAIICNHQRSVSKTHDAQMTRLNDKIAELKEQQEEVKEDLSRAKRGKPLLKDKDGKPKRNLSTEALEKKLAQVDAKIEKIELDKKIKEDLKTVALGTSKINYLDPRISVAWCKRNEVPIEKIFNKSLLAKFSWAMDADPAFRF